MNYLARRAAAGKPLRTPGFLPSQADQLRDLARRVRHLGRADRLNPVESLVLAKLEVAAELDALADRAEGTR